jgi:hypothetical protein
LVLTFLLSLLVAGAAQARPFDPPRKPSGFLDALRQWAALLFPAKAGIEIDPDGATLDAGSDMDPNGATLDEGPDMDPDGAKG